MNLIQQSVPAPASVLVEEHASLLESLRALPRSAWVLFLGIFLNRFGTFIIPFLSLYLTRKGYSFAQTAIAVSAYGVGTLLACFLGGYLADHIGRRKTITLSMISGAATMLLLSQAHSWWGITLLTFLNGLAGELYRPASSALLADLVPNGQRVIAFSTYRMALNAGWAFGPATAGFVANHSFVPLFIGDAFTSLLFGLVAWFALPHGSKSSPRESGWSVALPKIARDRGFLQYLVASIFIAWIFFQLSSSYGLFVSQLGFSTAVCGALISFNGLIVACCELPISNLTRRIAPRRCIACGYLLVGMGMGLNAFATTIPWLATGIFILTLGEMISLPIGAAYIADLAPGDMRGRYMGAFGFTWSFALIFGPALGLFLLARSATLLWSACAISGLIGASIITWRVRREQLPLRATLPAD